MTNKDIYRSLGGLDPELIIKAAPTEKAVKKKNNVWLRFGAIAACFIVALSAVILIPTMHADEPDAVADSDSGDRYNDFSIISGEYGIVWPWEYKTVYEKYFSINVDGSEFVGRKRALPSSYVGEMLGTYKATGYDDTSDKTYFESFEAYTVKGVAPDRLIAVKMENHYYAFISKKYSPPEKLGGVLEAYSLPQYVELEGFSVNENGKAEAYRLLNDDEFVWNALNNAKNAEAADPIGWHENRGDYISFTVTAEALGVYKRAMYVTESGYVWTNAFDGEYLYFIGADVAGSIIRYAEENSVPAKSEPFNKTVAGKVVEITEGYILVDDSVLCKNPEDGITYKIMINDVRISRYVECGAINVGGTVIVVYEGDIDKKNGNKIFGAIDISEGIITSGDILIPE